MTTRTIGGHTIDFGDMPDAQIDQLIQTPDFQTKLGGFQPGWLERQFGTPGREAALVGGNLLTGLGTAVNPLLRLTADPHERAGTAVGEPWLVPQDLGPTPVGLGENLLARGSQVAGFLAPAAVTGAVGPRALVAATTGGVFPELRRTVWPMPEETWGRTGQVVDVAGSTLLGGLVGGTAGQVARARALGQPMMSPNIRAAIGTTVGEGLEALARHALGLPPWLAQVASIPGAWLGSRIAGAFSGQPLSRAGATVAGTTAYVTEPTQNQLSPTGGVTP